MLNEAELIILSSFFPEGTERTAKEIEERSGYSHERVHSTLVSLKRKRILSNKKAGKTLIYSIRKFEDAAYLAFAYHSLSRKSEFAAKHPLLAGALEVFLKKSNPSIAILFGSHSKGEAKESSDIDLLCVNASPNSEKIALSLRHEYNARITPVMVKISQFGRIMEDNPPMWDDIMKFGIILKGTELFYNLVYR